MGCDIHAYVEYSKNGKHWRNLTDNAGSRNYVMFGVLAGVRVADAKLFDPKGMPEGELSFTTAGDYWLNVAPESNPDWADGDGWTSLENARRWVESGYSVPDYRDETLKRVSGPDWHSHSWLTTDELAAAIEHYRTVVGNYWPEEGGRAPTEWVAILAAMRAIESNGETARVVFWFDN